MGLQKEKEEEEEEEIRMMMPIWKLKQACIGYTNRRASSLFFFFPVFVNKEAL